MKSAIMLFLMLVICSSCVSNTCDYQPAPYLGYIDEIIVAHARETKKLEGLNFGAEGGEFMGQVKVFDLFYTSNKCATIDEARQIFVRITQNFIERLNAHTEIRPYLQKFPADNTNVQIGIRFEDCDKLPNQVENVLICGNTVKYVQWTGPYTHKVIHQETYQEALRIVESQVKVLP